MLDELRHRSLELLGLMRSELERLRLIFAFYSCPDKFCPLDTPARHGQNFSGYLYQLDFGQRIQIM